jgi:hypothetical protein
VLRKYSSSLETDLIEELENSVQSLGLQLEPLSAFAQERNLCSKDTLSRLPIAKNSRNRLQERQVSAVPPASITINSNNSWMWSPEHQAYYYYRIGPEGELFFMRSFYQINRQPEFSYVTIAPRVVAN